MSFTHVLRYCSNDGNTAGTAYGRQEDDVCNSWVELRQNKKKTGGGSKKHFGFWQPFCCCEGLHFMSLSLKKSPSWCLCDSWEQGCWRCPGEIHCSSLLPRMIFLPNVTETLFGAKWTFWSGESLFPQRSRSSMMHRTNLVDTFVWCYSFSCSCHILHRDCKQLQHQAHFFSQP